MGKKYIKLVAGQSSPTGEVVTLGIGRHCFTGPDDPPSSLYLPTPWQADADILNAAAYCEELYLSFLNQLMLSLNAINKLNGGIRSYEIFLGYWLIDFIHQAYDKYTCIKKAAALHPDGVFLVSSTSNFYIPVDFNEYQIGVISDKYALQIYSQIISFLQLPSREAQIVDEAAEGNNSNKSQVLSLQSRFKKSARQAVFKTWNRLVSSIYHKRYVSVVTPYFKSNQLKSYLRLIWFLRGKAVFPQFDVESGLRIKEAKASRGNLGLMDAFASDKDEFKQVLALLIEKNLPLNFLERLENIVSHDDIRYITNSCAVYSGNSHYFSDALRYAVGFLGTSKPFLVAQHGGGYGIWNTNLGEWWERRTSSHFLVWGWADTARKNEVNVSFLSKAESTGNSINSGKDVVFITNTSSRYLRHIMLPAVFEERCEQHYLQPKLEFIRGLPDAVPLRVRTYPSDPYKWGEKERLARVMQESAGFSNNTYDEDIKQAKIVVCDFVLTTVHETMALNIPTVLFGDETIISVRDSAKEIFRELEAVGIYHQSAKAAAQFVASIFADVDNWWLSSPVQAARNKFVDKYARVSKDPVRELAEYLNTFLIAKDKNQEEDHISSQLGVNR